MDSISKALLLFAASMEQVKATVLPLEELKAAMLKGFGCTE